MERSLCHPALDTLNAANAGENRQSRQSCQAMEVAKNEQIQEHFIAFHSISVPHVHHGQEFNGVTWSEREMVLLEHCDQGL